jgi:hypothetical protein
MTTGHLLDLLRPEVNATPGDDVFSTRSYLNSFGTRVLLIDMHDPNTIDRAATFIAEHAPTLTVSVIIATPLGGTRRRRIIVTGFEEVQHG